MALVSPGLQITVTDESQYVPAAVGTVPLIMVATAQDKVVNNSLATGTTKANAGKLQIFGSQRELVAALGYPDFRQTSAGTPLHGNELNEYGLMTAYSTLGVGNRVYVIRADIDLDELNGTSARPVGEVPDGTHWLDLSASTWGIFEWNADTQTFVNRAPIVITDENDLLTSPNIDDVLINVPTPLARVGQIGSYAVVATTSENRIFYKRYDNVWQLVGSTGWQKAWPTVIGTEFNPVITTGNTITINSVGVLVTGTTLADVVSAINSAAITGVTARNLNNRLAIYADKTAASNGATADGLLVITDSALATELGVSPTTHRAPTISYGSYAAVPAWDRSSNASRSSGSVWFKTGAVGGGSDLVFRIYNALTDTWTTKTTTAFTGVATATYGLDPTRGGLGIDPGTMFINIDPNPTGLSALELAGFRPRIKTNSGPITATTLSAPGTFISGSIFTLRATQPGTVSTTSSVVSVLGTSADDFVAGVLGANVPNVSAQVNADGTISLTHETGGVIYLISDSTPGSQNVPQVAGFNVGVSNIDILNETTRVVTGFTDLSYTYSITEPVADPVDGSLWYYSDATEIDIMINTGNSWAGYKTLLGDARGYDLSITDPLGVIVGASAPTTQTDNSALVAGDLWLDTSDLENFPKLSRYNGTSWTAIDNADQISQNGIVFADARWDTNGTTNVVTGNLPAITDLLTSDYTDVDAPNPQLYPRGTLLFNTRRSGFNIKRFVGNYFNAQAFSNVETWDLNKIYNVGDKVIYGTDLYVALETIEGETPNTSVSWSLLETAAWVTASGNQSNGAMFAGSKAQRAMIVEAMRSAIDSNTQIREDQFQFNLIVTPGYPEVISSMVSLNNDRANTAFVIGDTPMTMSTNVVEITNWSSGVTEGGLTTSDPYLGIYYPAGLTTDLQGNPIVVPASHMAMRTFIRNDNVSYPWFAPAGTRRGLVDNATDLGYIDAGSGEFVRTGVSQSLRDSLYLININPITILTGVGIVVWGQKTRNPTTSALDRVNVARLVNYIRTILANVGNGFLFEPNDKITRDQLKQIIESALNDLVAKRGVYDYLVVCDNSNNTPDRIARNELYVDIAIEPMKGVEFIYIPIRLVNPGTLGALGT
jgi:hypothetical protein